jgi:exodeoxyribonuclease VII large subunit
MKNNKSIKNIKNKNEDYDNLSDEFNQLINKNTKSNIKISNDLDESDNSDDSSDSNSTESSYDNSSEETNLNLVSKNVFTSKTQVKPQIVQKELSIEENLEILYKQLNAVLLSNKLRSLIGEIITYKISGFNAYMTIKISNYQISCNFWQITKSKDLEKYKSFKDGDMIKISGNFSILQKGLSVYFNVKSMDKVGLGDYIALHELNRKKIVELGWNLNKKVLNKFPMNIGIVTSMEGAAIQDILQAFKSDNFVGNIFIINAIVQGKNCPTSVISKIDWMEKNYPQLDIMMITRGGGSFEDLVGFSDWDLITRIHECKIITLSAVGHQIDNQLSDEVSDYKFATPSLGAKFITSTQQSYINNFRNFKTMIKYYDNKIIESKEKLKLVNESNQKIISNFNIKEIKLKLYKYTSFVKNLINNYQSAKNNYFNQIKKSQPKILKSGIEITSINDIVNTSPKKIEIVLPDGRAIISYRVLEFIPNE